MIINGDCIEKIKDLADNSIDCIVTSPPYWKGFEYEAYFNSYAQYLEWCERWLKECKRVLKPNGTFWLNVINDSDDRCIYNRLSGSSSSNKCKGI